MTDDKVKKEIMGEQTSEKFSSIIFFYVSANVMKSNVFNYLVLEISKNII